MLLRVGARRWCGGREEIDAALAVLRARLLEGGAVPAHAVYRHIAAKASELAGPQDQALIVCEAAARGREGELAAWLASGGDPNATDLDRRRPLHHACEQGQLSAAKALVDAGADVNAADCWGVTPLLAAMQHGHGAVQEYLAEHGAAAGRVSESASRPAAGVQSLLLRAAETGDVATMDGLLAASPERINERDIDQQTPLHAAAEEGHYEAAAYLIQNGADLHAVDRWGQTPYALALRSTHNDIAELLVDSGFSRKAAAAAEAYPHEQRQVRRFWDGTAAATGWTAKGGPVLPTAALLLRLRTEYGFKLASTPALAAEIAAVARPLEDTAVEAAFVAHGSGALRGAVDAFNEAHPLPHDMAPADPEGRAAVERSVILYEDFADAVLRGNPAHTSRAGGAAAGILAAVVLDKLRVKNWGAFRQNLRAIYDHVLEDTPNDGATADYIPQLRDADPDRFAVSICTVDGQVLNLGDADATFSVQSIGKTFAYTMALREHGAREVHRYVGQEPSGRAFNAFALTRHQVPFNPVTNAGAIMTCSLLHNHLDGADARMEPYKQFLSDLAGGVPIGDCMDVYASEQGCAYNNYALANFMKAQGGFAPHVDDHAALSEAVEFYLRVCSTEVSAPILAAIAATYANHGTSPLTGASLLSESEVKQTLQILASCGMYDFSGEWACTIGMPSKSGVSGGIFVVVPGVAGMCVWSPKLDAIGNSVRGIRFCEAFSKKFRSSVLDLLFRAKLG